ncbi:MAG: PQQ-binding-like beta-propeller repeat protein, partial [Blastopirellula sp. JB062]
MNDSTATSSENRTSDVESTAPALAPRVWPLIVLAIFQLAVLTVPGWISPNSMFHLMTMMWGAFGCLFLAGLWLVAFSRLPARHRIYSILFLIAIGAAVVLFSHASMQPLLLLVLIAPWALVASGAAALLLTPLGWRWQRATLVLIWLATGVFALSARFDGVRGSVSVDYSPRWVPTKEEALLAELERKPIPLVTPDLDPSLSLDSDWPGFRGASRDGVLRDAKFALDWNERPPQELWRNKIGPGWSSFCVFGDRIATQEQRGADELVVCYEAQSGKPIWRYAIPARFEEPLAGPGPRATPTYHDGKLYSLGASGFVSCVDAITGEEIWRRDLKEDVGAKTPEWGFSSSPLIVGETAIVFAGDQQDDGDAVVAYDLASGELAWKSGRGSHSYSSPHLATLAGVDQVVMLTDYGVQGLAPSDGQVLWEHEWDIKPGNRVVQPQVIDDSVYVGTGIGMGTMKVDVKRDADAWSTQEAWISRNLKPY